MAVIRLNSVHSFKASDNYPDHWYLNITGSQREYDKIRRIIGQHLSKEQFIVYTNFFPSENKRASARFNIGVRIWVNKSHEQIPMYRRIRNRALISKLAA